VAQESQLSGKILGDFNQTFMFVIPKKQEASYFEDFRPISYCNMIYKLISKIIANTLNPLLSDIISKEQFGFIFKRKIHDEISVA
jgi:hypothetical protein